MTEVIFDELTAARDAAIRDGEQLAHRARAFLAGHLHHKEGTTMDLAAFEQDIRNDVQAGMDKAADLYNHLKAVAEQRLPELAALQQSPVAQAIEGVVLPPEIEAELTSIVKTYAARFGTAAITEAPAPAEPAADPLPAQ